MRSSPSDRAEAFCLWPSPQVPRYRIGRPSRGGKGGSSSFSFSCAATFERHRICHDGGVEMLIAAKVGCWRKLSGSYCQSIVKICHEQAVTYINKSFFFCASPNTLTLKTFSILLKSTHRQQDASHHQHRHTFCAVRPASAGTAHNYHVQNVLLVFVGQRSGPVAARQCGGQAANPEQKAQPRGAVRGRARFAGGPLARPLPQTGTCIPCTRRSSSPNSATNEPQRHTAPTTKEKHSVAINSSRRQGGTLATGTRQRTKRIFTNRECHLCGTRFTSQWRTGPTGPSSYPSRLFSPTFVKGGGLLLPCEEVDSQP